MGPVMWTWRRRQVKAARHAPVIGVVQVPEHEGREYAIKQGNAVGTLRMGGAMIQK